MVHTSNLVVIAVIAASFAAILSVVSVVQMSSEPPQVSVEQVQVLVCHAKSQSAQDACELRDNQIPPPIDPDEGLTVRQQACALSDENLTFEQICENCEEFYPTKICDGTTPPDDDTSLLCKMLGQSTLRNCFDDFGVDFP